MNRIYHSHDKWEEVSYNMYGGYHFKDKDLLIQKTLDFFRNKSLMEKYMALVIDTFTNSCEHNFTNPSINKVAWLGQASVALCYQIPENLVREAWSYLEESFKDQANKIAEEEIKRWFKFQKDIEN